MEPGSPPEADATPDEAYDLGKVAGYDEGFADGRKSRDGEVAIIRQNLGAWQATARTLWHHQQEE